MNLTCPECKNQVDLSNYPNLKPEMVIECNHCGITLGVTKLMDDGSVETEIVEEGK
ncbi:MAG: hypothetical protein HYY51_00175 [Candidatus Magasanikbacteria bacterium]|nr:hypothetical protein [Candidatus Magasanikbacteria bacterium]